MPKPALVGSALADRLDLSNSERKELLPSGQLFVFDSRVRYARNVLKRAGLLETASKGYYQITSRGMEYLINSTTERDAAQNRPASP